MRIVSQTYNNSRDLHLVLRKDRHREVKFLASESQQALGGRWGGEDRFKSTWLAWAHMLPTCSLLFEIHGRLICSSSREQDRAIVIMEHSEGGEGSPAQTGLPERTPTSICSVCRYYHSPLVPLLPHHHHHCSLLYSTPSPLLPTTTTAPELPIQETWLGSGIWTLAPLYLAPRGYGEVFWQSIESFCYHMVFVDSSWQLNFLLNFSGSEMKRYDGRLKSYFNVSSPIERAKWRREPSAREEQLDDKLRRGNRDGKGKDMEGLMRAV